ncbi:TPA: hypothetical protein PC505_003926 [Morganella morganii]|nr:hypothetical protein [Morganella morganii]HDF2424471.1 hypothetical protein [Morganella morganii]
MNTELYKKIRYVKDLINGKKQSPAFEFYIKKLNRGDKLPRGRYFKNRIAGTKPVARDEFWMGGFK